MYECIQNGKKIRKQTTTKTLGDRFLDIKIENSHCCITTTYLPIFYIQNQLILEHFF